MKQAVEEIAAMAERLEASGFSREQSDAAIRAIANSIEKFAVTPDVLRDAFREQSKEFNKRFDELRAECRSLSARLSTLTLSLALSVIAVLSTIIAQHWL